MEDKRVYILADDIELIEERLREFSGYDFAKDVSSRMKALELTQSALAARIYVKHTAVGKWLNQGTRPHGKERYKELGMALGMDETQLNMFLLANGYPRLYVKNPLDIACRFVLGASAGDEHIVCIYRDFLKFYKLDGYTLSGDPADISTSVLSRDFSNVKSIGSLEAWLEENNSYFRAFDKSYIPNAELVRFVLLYIGSQNVNELFITGELPVTIKNLLYPLIADKEIAVKKLRSKLIVFGLYENMSEHEINIMLDIAKLRPISEPSTRIDHVIFTALNRAHERYPYFERDNAEKVLKNLEENEMPDLRGFYDEQKRLAYEFVKYYEKKSQKSKSDELFEKYYTGYSDRGIIHYIHDILVLLVTNGVIAKEETDKYITLMQTY